MTNAFTRSVIAIALITAASSAAALSVADVQKAFADRADQSLTLTQYIQQVALKDIAALPAEQAEAVLAYALQNTANDDELLSLVKSALEFGISSDSILTAAVSAGKDPATVASVLNTATAAGPAATAFAPAAGGLAPTAIGFGGGSGGGSGTVSSN